MTVQELSPGDEFRVDGVDLEYRLIYANNCRAHVEPLGRVKRQVKDNEGNVLAEFESPKGRTDIAPATVCQLLKRGEMEDDIEDLVGTRPRTSFLDGTTILVKPKNADIFHPPQAAKRPLRPKTTRALMFEAIMGGTTSIKALCEEFHMKRQLVLAHIWEMWNSCGYGYTVAGDIVELVPPLDDAGDLL